MPRRVRLGRRVGNTSSSNLAGDSTVLGGGRFAGEGGISYAKDVAGLAVEGEGRPAMSCI